MRKRAIQTVPLNVSLDSCSTWWRAEAVWWRRTWFLCIHIDHAITAKSSGFFSCKIIQDRSSLKSRKWTDLRKCHSSGSDQTMSSSWHNHNACSEVSKSTWQQSHRGSSMIVCRTKFSFIGMAFQHARHSMFIFCGTQRGQIFLHSFESRLDWTGAIHRSDSSFRKW